MRSCTVRRNSSRARVYPHHRPGYVELEVHEVWSGMGQLASIIMPVAQARKLGCAILQIAAEAAERRISNGSRTRRK